MIPSGGAPALDEEAVYQRGWMIDSQPRVSEFMFIDSISKGMDD